MKPTMRSARGAFTLIELLIVVAIIAILAAIAVPNFLEAQTRSKISRAKTDMRTVTVAITAQTVDTNKWLIDWWDDDNQPLANQRCMDTWGYSCVAGERGGTFGVLRPLTTPIAYLTSIPRDVFAEKGDVEWYDTVIEDDRTPPLTFRYVDNDPVFTNDGGQSDFNLLFFLQENEFFLTSPGPNKRYDRPGDFPDFISIYDPTNGTISDGNIEYSNTKTFAVRFGL